MNDPNENPAFLPFGSGIRACVGQKFVIQGVAALFAALLKHYEVFTITFSYGPFEKYFTGYLLQIVEFPRSLLGNV